MTKQHKVIAVGAGILLVLLVARAMAKKKSPDGKITIGTLTVGRDAQGRCVCERNEQLADGTLKLTKVDLDVCREDPQLFAQIELLCGGPSSDPFTT